MSSPSIDPSDSLWLRIQQQTQHALQCGALQPIHTHLDFIEEAGVRFVVRMLANLARKEKAKADQEKAKAKGKEFNPFLPYEPDLFVGNLSDTHLCLLNKYNVVDHHVLIITRAFEEQDSWITLADFEALSQGMAAIDGLGFYNGGAQAGASQRHKHLQIVPLPMGDAQYPLPIHPLVQPLLNEPGIATLSCFTFPHGLKTLTVANWEDPAEAGAVLLQSYHDLLSAVGIDDTLPVPTVPYNLLVTRQWMMLIPRSQDSYQSIPVNSLGFAGSLLVKNPAQLALLREIGPMQLLKSVSL